MLSAMERLSVLPAEKWAVESPESAAVPTRVNTVTASIVSKGV
jgi:hypothetical protein